MKYKIIKEQELRNKILIWNLYNTFVRNLKSDADIYVILLIKVFYRKKLQRDE